MYGNLRCELTLEITSLAEGQYSTKIKAEVSKSKNYTKQENHVKYNFSLNL